MYLTKLNNKPANSSNPTFITWLYIRDKNDEEEDDSDEDSESSSNTKTKQSYSQYSLLSMPCKMVFLVCMELKMDKGKIAAQVGHATLGAYKQAKKHSPSVLTAWSGNVFSK